MGDLFIHDYILGEDVLNQAEATGLEGRVEALEATGTTISPGYRMDFSSGTLDFNPISDIVNVTGTSVTLQPDTAYKIIAATGAVNVTANPPAADKWGYEGHAEIFVASVGYVVCDTSKIVLANQLEPDSVNNCTLRFHDGMCYVSVEDHIAGYVVTVTTGTTAGSLPYALSSASQEYIAFDATTEGTLLDMGGAVTNGEKHIAGNGYTETALTGAVDCGTSKFTVANLSLQNVTVNGGVMTLGDVFISSGSTVAVSGGGLAIEKVTGAGETSVIDLGGTNTKVDGCQMSGVTITGGSGTNGGALSTAHANTFVNCIFSGNHATGYGESIYATSNSVDTLSNCTVIDTERYGLTARNSSMIIISGGTFGGARVFADCSIELHGSVTLGIITSGSSTSAGSVTIGSGAIIDLTGNTNPTPIAPGGGITFEAGGATVKVGDAAASSSCMMDNVTLPAGAKLTNTAVVDLGGITNIVISSGSTASVSGATIVSAYWTANKEGAITVFGNLVLSDCIASGNVVGGTKRDLIASGGVATIHGGYIENTQIDTNGHVVLADHTSIGEIRARGANNYGTVAISSGAIIDLTGNTNATPINPGGGITISSGGISIIDSAGSMHEFQNVAITGSTINNLGQILGATVSIPASGGAAGPWNIYTTLGSSTVSATAEAQELVIEGGLVRIEEL